jgi:Fe-S-cluster containining protein
MKWQPLLSPEELHMVAAALGISTRAFNRRYTRPYPLKKGHRQFLTGDTGGCVFLAPGEEGRYLCSIYESRPQVCRDWKAGTDKRECLEGAKRLGLQLQVPSLGREG